MADLHVMLKVPCENGDYEIQTYMYALVITNRK